MGKYNKEKQVKETKLADHKRVCRVCHLVTYHWLHCGQRTACLNMEGKRPEFTSSRLSRGIIKMKCEWCRKFFICGGHMAENQNGHWELVCSSKCHAEGKEKHYYK